MQRNNIRFKAYNYNWGSLHYTTVKIDVGSKIYHLTYNIKELNKLLYFTFKILTLFCKRIDFLSSIV